MGDSSNKTNHSNAQEAVDRFGLMDTLEAVIEKTVLSVLIVKEFYITVRNDESVRELFKKVNGKDFDEDKYLELTKEHPLMPHLYLYTMPAELEKLYDFEVSRLYDIYRSENKNKKAEISPLDEAFDKFCVEYCLSRGAKLETPF